MYGLPQAGILANKLLKERLELDGYTEQPHTPGLFKHKARPVWFNLTADDFGISISVNTIWSISLQHYENTTKLWKTEPDRSTVAFN
jgi:hypothetical protein